MTLTTKTQVIILSITAVVCIAVGRYTVSSPEVITTKDITQDKSKQEDKDIHTHEVVTSTKKVDGTTTTTKVIDTDTISSKATQSETTAKIMQDIIPPKTGTTNVSALLSNNFSNGLWSPAYGVSVTHEVLGPLSVGAFGLTSGIVGVSVGITF